MSKSQFTPDEKAAMQLAHDELLAIGKKYNLTGCFLISQVGNPIMINDMFSEQMKVQLNSIDDLMMDMIAQVGGVTNLLLQVMHRYHLISVAMIKEDKLKDHQDEIDEAWSEKLHAILGKIIADTPIMGFAKQGPDGKLQSSTESAHTRADLEKLKNDGSFKEIDNLAVQGSFKNRMAQVVNAVSGNYYGVDKT